MSARNLGRHAMVSTPAAMLLMVASAPWGGATAPTSDPTPEAAPAPAPTVPTDALEAQASVPGRAVVAPGVRPGSHRAMVSTSVSGIPDPALAAYQRAETVINAADKSCNITWQLIAAIGRVESDHGRVNGSSLDAKGVATPGIYGIRLDGRRRTAVIRDTDAGQYDADRKWDRAVGPMQFIPSTWSVVGVDGDNDGKRNPQDVDDAALATAVYLCSGNHDLSEETGRRPAVFRYNHDHGYVDLVLSLMDAYLEGDYTSVPHVAGGYVGTYASTAAAVRPAPEEPRRSRDARSAGKPGQRKDDPVRDPAGATDDGKGPRDSEVQPGPEDTEQPPTPPPGVDTEPTDNASTSPDDTGADTDVQAGPDEEPGQPSGGEGDSGTVPPPPAGEQPAEEQPAEEPTEQPAPTPEALREQAVQLCLDEVGATADQLPDLEALGRLSETDFSLCMTEQDFPL